MSHFSTIAVELQGATKDECISLLVHALTKSADGEPMKLYGGRVITEDILEVDREHGRALREYTGETSGRKGHVVVRKENLAAPRVTTDLGFEVSDEGKVVAFHCDDHNGEGEATYWEDWSKRLLSRYAASKIVTEAESNGHSWELVNDTEQHQEIHVTSVAW